MSGQKTYSKQKYCQLSVILFSIFVLQTVNFRVKLTNPEQRSEFLGHCRCRGILIWLLHLLCKFKCIILGRKNNFTLTSPLEKHTYVFLFCVMKIDPFRLYNLGPLRQNLVFPAASEFMPNDKNLYVTTS